MTLPNSEEPNSETSSVGNVLMECREYILKCQTAQGVFWQNMTIWAICVVFEKNNAKNQSFSLS